MASDRAGGPEDDPATPLVGLALVELAPLPVFGAAAATG